ncbi:MAG: hypothetical protein AAGD32_14945 [Planctomycetota bacterium]
MSAHEPQNVGPIDLGYDGGGRGGIVADERCVQALSGTRPWIMVWAVLMFLGGGLFAIGSLGLIIMAGVSGGGGDMPMFLGIGVGYFIGAAIYILLGVMLIRYFAAIGRTVRNRQTDDLYAALNAQKNFWRLAAIILITFIVLYFVVVALAIAFTAL